MAATITLAQNYEFKPPQLDLVDSVGVSLISGQASFEINPVSIGPKSNPLGFRQKYDRSLDGPSEGQFGGVTGGNNFATYPAGYLVVKVFGKSEVFMGDRASTYTSWGKNGGRLILSNGFAVQYIDRDGVKYDFMGVNAVSACTNNLIQTSNSLTEQKTYTPWCSTLKRVTYPDGRTLDLTLYVASYGQQTALPQGIVRSDGFALHVDYLSQTPVWSGSPGVRVSGVTAINLAVDYCDVTQVTMNCAFSKLWPTANYSWSPFDATNLGDTSTLTLTDMTGAVTRYTEQILPSVPQGNQYRAVVGVKAPSSPSTDTVSFVLNTLYACVANSDGSAWDCSAKREGLVDTAYTADGTWKYVYGQPFQGAPPQSLASQIWTTTATRPDGFQTIGTYNVRSTYIQSVTAPNGQLEYETNWPTSANRLLNAIDSEGRRFIFTFDDRGNMLSKQQVRADGTLAPAWQASYDTICSNQVTCNKPNWLRNPEGAQTDYVYDSTHGGIISETLPADTRGIRPQKRYTYVQRRAWTKNSGGGYTPSAPIWVLNSMSFCRNSAFDGTYCIAPGNDMVVTTYEYGPDSGPNNLLLRGQTVTADGTSLRTCYVYDHLGNRIRETTPGAGLAACQ